MSVEDTGPYKITQADDMNVPVNIGIHNPTKPGEKWMLTAANYMPRKDWIEQSRYSLEADTREELVEIVHKHIVPIYETALESLKTTGELYCWEKP